MLRQNGTVPKTGCSSCFVMFRVKLLVLKTVGDENCLALHVSGTRNIDNFLFLDFARARKLRCGILLSPA